MSTTHGQPGLSSDQRSTIRSTILSTRRTLEDELRRQLEKYGIYEDKRLALEELSHLTEKERHTRRTLDAAIERELESTEGDLERSITNYVREATKTYLNRFVALKTIEVRGLVEETITERPEYGNRSYIHHTVAEIAGELTNAPDDGFGAALDLAYQEIGAEIRMIFEDSEHTAIDLDAQVREEVLDDLDAIDDDAWESDEALGWVYQYFGEKEREEIDDRVDEENYKIAGTDIATKTQLFTPRYIVEWMVDNSLGRTWLEMQGERTNIDDEENCFYLAPLEDSLIDRETKAVEDITVLDPACGSGHMLFYAFDVLHQMYLEEGEVPEEYIPREILRNNLYGIDIDSGAAQIAALSLYLKAKEKSPDVTIPQLNIVSADAVLINGDRKADVLNSAQSDLERKILEQIWRSFDNIREFGSLIRIEERIDEILEEYREALEATGQAKFTKEGSFSTQSTFVSAGGEEETWEEVKSRLLENIHELAAGAIERNDPVEEMFVGEVGKTVELLDVLVRGYDVTISNPPYLGSSKMDDELKQFVSDNYIGSRDLYSAFIERCWQFTETNGYASLVTPENYLFIASFAKLRQKIVQDKTVVEGAHLSGFSFSDKDRPFTVPILLRNTQPAEEDSWTRFSRLTHEQEEYDSHEKTIRGLIEVADSVRERANHPDIYTIDQNLIKNIRRYPFVYWFGDELLELFQDHPSLGEVSEISGGVKSGDNDHFLRKFWEVSESVIGDDYQWYVENGEYIEYYDKIDTVIKWQNGGENIIKYSEEEGTYYQGLSDTDWYFDESVIFRDFSRLFVAKHIPDGCIFSHTVYRVKPDEGLPLSYLLAYMNSSLYRFIASGINPTLHYNPGDAGAVPIEDSPGSGQLDNYVNMARDRRKSQYSLNETARSFSEDTFTGAFADGVEGYLFRKDILVAEIGILQGIIDEMIFDNFGLSSETRGKIHDNQRDNLSQLPHHGQIASNDDHEFELLNKVPKKSGGESVELSSVDWGRELLELAEELEISPYTVAALRRENDLYSDDEKSEAAGELLSYTLGVIFGRWETLDDDVDMSDEILAFGRTEESNIEALMEHGLESLFTNSRQIKQELQNYLDKPLEEWMRDDFFRYHHCKEYRRRGQRIPIYWQLESPDGGFSCYIYYHDIDTNTLPKLRGQYLDPRINELENELETLNAQTSGESPDKELLNRKEEVQNDLDDIREFRDTIDEMIDDGVSVDVEKGIWENIKEWDQYEVLETGLPKLKSSYSR